MPVPPRDTRRAFFARLTRGGGALAAAIAISVLSALVIGRNAHDPVYASGRAAEETSVASVHNDSFEHARAIWEERCSRCHGLAGAGGDKAPDFKGYDSRAWIRGFLENPQGRLYMGTAKIDKGMKPVVGTADELDALTEMVYQETGAPDADALRAARGRELVPQHDCDTCHEVDGEGENAGPNFKGRGTLAWVEAVISDAGQGRLFGEKNKMPRFAGKLTRAEIEEMARFVIAQRAGPAAATRIP
jgi:mono/diheme cytochrome c family protein